jgi:Kef-type K+ transport system membrane component KefB
MEVKAVHDMNETIKDLILILAVGGLFGFLFEIIKFPKVIGYLMGGVILSPLFFNAVTMNSQINIFVQVGVILLMFIAGLQVNLEEFKKDSIASFFIGLFGVILPLIVGYLIATLFYTNFYTCLFIGAILTATSVSVSVAVLNELNRLNTPVGAKILGAAIVDDIIGLVLVAFILSLSASSASDVNRVALSSIILDIIIFLVLAGLLLIFMPIIIRKITIPKGYDVLLALIYMFILVYVSELFGIAGITGAFIAGLSLSKLKNKKDIENQLSGISDNFFSIIFFASIGLALEVESIDQATIMIIAIFFIVAIITKLIGCGLAAKLFKSDNQEAWRIGLGMVARGEVAIIVARLGLQANLIDNQTFFEMIVVIVLATLISPVLLKFSYRKD